MVRTKPKPLKRTKRITKSHNNPVVLNQDNNINNLLPQKHKKSSNRPCQKGNPNMGRSKVKIDWDIFYDLIEEKDVIYFYKMSLDKISRKFTWIAFAMLYEG